MPGKTVGTLKEQSWPSLAGTPPVFTFNEAEKPTERLLLSGVSQINKETPIFRYYRYYEEGDTNPKYGQIDENPILPETKAAAEEVTKVTTSFTLTPEVHGSPSLKDDRAVPFEDSALLTLSLPSESASASNEPCSQRS